MKKHPTISANRPPVALTIAGSDSSAGAGVQADLKTFAAHGVYGVCALTALVAESPEAVREIESVDNALLISQLESVASVFPLSIIKTGMLSSAELVGIVVRFVHDHSHLPLVVDPVLRAGAGDSLLSDDGLERMKNELLPLAHLVTPNVPEAEVLLGCPIETENDFLTSPFQLHQRYGVDFLVKGGHFPFGNPKFVTDHAWIDGQMLSFSRRRLSVPDLHGTGCTLASAIAAQVALGHQTSTAVSRATDYLTACMEQHFSWPVEGASIEALNHFPDGVEFGRS